MSGSATSRDTSLVHDESVLLFFLYIVVIGLQQNTITSHPLLEVNSKTKLTFGISWGYGPLSRGGNFGGLSRLRCCDNNCSLVAATMLPFPFDMPLVPEELPEDPVPLPATLYGSSSGIGIRGRFFMSTVRFTTSTTKKYRFNRLPTFDYVLNNLTS